MAEEKKTYLVNIESNLKKYADEAAAAKVKVDELKASNDLLKKSGQENTAEYQLGIAAQKAAQKEYAQTLRNIGVLTSANKENATTRDKLNAIVTIETQKLKALGDGYITNADGLKKVNPLYITQKQNVAAANLAIIEYDQSLNKGGTNVGRYGASVKAAIGEAASSMFAFAAPIAVATAALNGLKEAFLGTEAGAKLLTRAKTQLSAFFESIITGKFGYAFGKQLPKDIKAAADLMDKIRIDQRNELVIVAQKELEIKDLRLESVKAGKGSVKQAALLVEAQEKEKELIAYKLGQKEEELTAVNMLLEHQKTNTVLLNQQAQLEAEILNIKGEKSLRMATKLQAIEEKKIADAAKKLEQTKKQDIDAEKEAQSFIDKELARMDKEADDKWNMEVDLQRKIFEQNRKAGQSEYDARIKQEEALADAVIKIHESMEDSKMRIAASATDFLSSIAGNNKALQNASLIADKAFAIAQVVIATTKANATIRAMSAASVLPGPGYLARLGIAMAAAQAPINLNRIAAVADIAAIIAATVASLSKGSSGGGSASAPTAITSSPPAQRTLANPVGSTILTQQQLTQPQLNAMPNQNSLTADDIAYALSKMPPPIVTVEDINAKAASKRKVEVRANI